MDGAFLSFISEYMVIALSRQLTNPDSQKGKGVRIRRIAECPSELAASDFSKETFDRLKAVLKFYSMG